VFFFSTRWLKTLTMSWFGLLFLIVVVTHTKGSPRASGSDVIIVVPFLLHANEWGLPPDQPKLCRLAARGRQVRGKFQTSNLLRTTNAPRWPSQNIKELTSDRSEFQYDVTVNVVTATSPGTESKIKEKTFRHLVEFLQIHACCVVVRTITTNKLNLV